MKQKNEIQRKQKHSRSKTKNFQQERSRDNIMKFEQELDAVVNSFASEPIPDVLYHYTTWNGAEGILTSRRIRATAHDCTNDPAELHSADEIIVTVARDLYTRFATSPAQEALDIFLTNYHKSQVMHFASIFLSCFSQARDKESQWQKYADQGHGLCLGIRLLREEKSPDRNPTCALLHVDYSRESWEFRIKQCFSKVCLRLNQAGTVSPAKQRQALELALNALYRIAAYAAVSAKTATWANEEEWRIVALVPKNGGVSPSQRCVYGKCFNYLDLAMRQRNNPLSLDEILIGPNQDIVEAQHRLQCLLKGAGYPHESAPLPKVTPSAVVWIK